VSYLSTFRNRESFQQLVKLTIIGVVNTVVDFALFNLFRVQGVSLVPSLILAFTLATLVSYVLNRLWTFKIKHGKGLTRESLAFLLVNAVALAVTVGLVQVADVVWGPLSRFGENVAKLVAGGIVTFPKLAGFRDLVFKRSLALAGAQSDPKRVEAHLPERLDGDAAGR
jgi:putative flippase GtrA